MPSDETERDDVSERVARGFEALVSEESAVHGGAGVAANPPPGPAPTFNDAPMSIAATRLVALEGRVRQTMDRLTELVEAQLPETVDGLRADLETLRLELQTSLAQAGELMAEERKQLRTQIATTVGAANRWFVRARDQIHERLDHIAEVAEHAQEQAELAALAAGAAVTAVTELEPGHKPEAADQDEGASERLSEAAAVEGIEEDDELEWEIEGEGGDGGVGGESWPKTTAGVTVDTPELEALLDPMRGDMQELQLEVASMGQAVSQLAGELARLSARIPARPRGVKLAPDQIELIVEAVMAALPPPPPPARAAKKPAVVAPAKKKAPGSAKRGAILR